MNKYQFFTQKKFNINDKPLFPMIFLISMLSGCAHTDWTIDLPLAEATAGYKGGEGRILVIPRVVDEREDKKRSGTKVGLGNIYPNHDIPIWFTSRLREELRSAGFKVLSDNTNGSFTKINGYLHLFFTEQVMQWSTLDFETDISFRIHIDRSDGLEAEKKYYFKGINQGQVIAAGHYVLAQNKATDALMKKIVTDLINLLNNYPEQHDFPQEGLIP